MQLASGERRLGKLNTPVGSMGEWAYAPGHCVPRHWHDKASLIYIVAGDHWATHSGGGGTCAARTVRFLPAGEPHETYFPVGSVCLELELDGSILQRAAERGRPISLPGELRDARAASLGAQLHRELLNGDDLAPLEVETVALQLLVPGSAAARERRSPAPPWVLQVAEMLREEMHATPVLAAIARAVGRHPVQVSRQFHRHFGCTLSDYIRRARIARAQSLLRRGQMQIADIALACGFCDQSHFTGAFRQLTGVPPHRYRLQSLRPGACQDDTQSG